MKRYGMTYSLTPDDRTASDALRRIAAALLGEAILQAQAAPAPGQLHAIRKNIKMIRGLLRLVAPHFAAYKAEDAALHHAAQQIAPHRDAEVLAEIAARIADGDPAFSITATPTFANLPADLAAVACALKEIAVRARHWQLDAQGFDAFECGLRTTWSSCRKHLKKLRKKHDDVSLHRWRACIKTHWYHARLLEPIWPEMMAPHIAAADILGELLGDHHDLAVLRAQIAQDRPRTKAVRAFDKTCAKRQAEAEREIFALAERFLAEPAKPLVARWRRWWRLWRG